MPTKKPRRILIIDDYGPYRRLLAEYFGHFGHITVTARDGREGIRKAACALVDVILSDMALPDMDGSGVIAGLAKTERTRHIPVVLITDCAAIRSEYPDLESKSNCGLIVRKPLDLDSLLSWIERNIPPAAQRLSRRKAAVFPASILLRRVRMRRPA